VRELYMARYNESPSEDEDVHGVTALIECGVCVPSNYTGFYIKCNLLRNKEK